MRKPGRSCGTLPTTTTVSLSLLRSNSPIRKEERLAIDASPDGGRCCLTLAGVPTSTVAHRCYGRRCVVEPTVFSVQGAEQRAQGRRKDLLATTCQRTARASCYGVRLQFWTRGRDTL